MHSFTTIQSQIFFAILIIIFIIVCDCANANICTSFGNVCVPTLDFDHGCNCALIRTDQIDDEWQNLKKKFGPDFQGIQPNIRLMQLPLTVVEQLNRFFAGDLNATLNAEVFANVSTAFFVKMITMPGVRFAQVINKNAAHLSEQTRNMLINCNNAICEQIGRFDEVIPPSKKIVNVIPMEKSVATKIDDILKRTIADREFKAEKVVRIEFGDNVLLAFSASKSTFSLTKTKDDMKREFTEALLLEWKQFENAQLIKAFRTYYGHLMI